MEHAGVLGWRAGRQRLGGGGEMGWLGVVDFWVLVIFLVLYVHMTVN